MSPWIASSYAILSDKQTMSEAGPVELPEFLSKGKDAVNPRSITFCTRVGPVLLMTSRPTHE
jgi:hypothetical protein